MKYKLVCRKLETGQEIFTVDQYDNEREANYMAEILNTHTNPNCESHWFVEPLYYN